MEAITKWIGSKAKYLDGILPLIPRNVNRYYEPFVGGGGLFLGVPDCGKFIITHNCRPLMDLYKEIQNLSPEFLNHLNNINASWKNLGMLVKTHSEALRKIYASFPEGRDYDYLAYVEKLNPLLEKISYKLVFPQRFRQTELFELEKRYYFSYMKMQSAKVRLNSPEKLDQYIMTSLKSALYAYYVELYNGKLMEYQMKRALLLFLLKFSSNGQFVLDQDGEFRPCYAGAQENEKTLDDTIRLICSPDFRNRMAKTEFHAQDYKNLFLRNHPHADDFVMVDPPLGKLCRKTGSELFTDEDMNALLTCLSRRKSCWMLLVKSAEITPAISAFASRRKMTLVGPKNDLAVITNYDPKHI